jgi:hypothetical protein
MRDANFLAGLLSFQPNAWLYTERFFWSELADLLKFISLLVAFILLLIVAYRKLEKKET